MKTMKPTTLLLLALGLAARLKAADAAPPADQSLDVTIQGESRDEIPLLKDPPVAEIPFDRIAGLSREGQTDRVLSGPVEHMAGADQMSLLRTDSRQAYLGVPVRVPAAPFIRMELSPGLSPKSWEFQVLDQDDKALKAAEGTLLPRHVVEWDGFQEGVFTLRPGPAYTPVLVLTDDRKRVQKLFGEPVRFSVLQYIQDGRLNVEFDNAALFERGRASFSADILPLLGASLDVLRRYVGKPIRVVVFAAPGGSLPVQKRLDALKAFYKDSLALEDDALTFAVQPMKDRGDVTQISVPVQ